MPEMDDDVDETAVRDALKDAYRRKADADPSAIELYAYATDLPPNTPKDVALSIAKNVLADPPDLSPDPEKGSQDSENHETPKSAGNGWEKANFSTTTAGVYPPEHTEYDAWMIRGADLPPYGRDKAPFAPWNESAKWGTEANRIGFEDALNWDEKHPKSDGLVHIQTEDDPFVFVDGDDVRCPETGDVHPAFVAVLEHLGETYADVSTSGTGVHAYYRGTLPDDETMADWEIDDEPFGANDDLPAIELYSGKHVCVTTGDHVDGTPHEVRPWNGEVVRPLLEANDEFTQSVQIDSSGVDRDSGSTDTDDPIEAVNRLDAAEVAEKTIVDEWTDTAGSRKAFLPSWGSSGDGGTANFVDETCWVDTGTRGGRGGPIEMALIDLGELSDGQSEVGCASGADFWTGYEHLRDLGFDLPEVSHDDTDSGPVSDYYDADLGAYVDGDPWSDPDEMLTACLMARAEGAVARDAEPPTLALTPIVREYLGVDEVSAETKDMAEDVFLNELSRSKHVTAGGLEL